MAKEESKADFPFLITYFKESGKYYTSAVVTWKIRHLDNRPTEPYIYDAVDKLRGLRDNGGQGALPGLNSGEWPGPILIEPARLRERGTHGSKSPDDYCGDGVPTILMPR